MSNSFRRLATAKARTYRATMNQSLMGEPQLYLDDVPCLPIASLDPHVRETLGLQSPAVLYQTMVDGNLDIRRGDIFEVDGKQYNIKEFEVAISRAFYTRLLVLEDVL